MKEKLEFNKFLSALPPSAPQPLQIQLLKSNEFEHWQFLHLEFLENCTAAKRNLREGVDIFMENKQNANLTL